MAEYENILRNVISGCTGAENDDLAERRPFKSSHASITPRNMEQGNADFVFRDCSRETPCNDDNSLAITLTTHDTTRYILQQQPLSGASSYVEVTPNI